MHRIVYSIRGVPIQVVDDLHVEDDRHDVLDDDQDDGQRDGQHDDVDNVPLHS